MKAAGVRISWADLPTSVHDAVAATLGGAVVEAVSQAGGFSPGTADRVRTADGRRAFVKAVGTELNAFAVELHRRETRITAAMPQWAPVPRLLGSYDDGDWVALVLDDVAGANPVTPWQPAELEHVLKALKDFSAKATPSPVPDLPSAADGMAYDLQGWQRIAADPPPDLDPWAVVRIDELCAQAEQGLAELEGDTLVHGDIRADNIILGPGGEVTFVDWPHACRGPSWLDSMLLMINARLYGARPRLNGMPRTTLVAIAGFFIDGARQPPPPGLPTVRMFQKVQGDAVLAWLQEDGIT
jgi:aminoglycoside phosphotransferase